MVGRTVWVITFPPGLLKLADSRHPFPSRQERNANTLDDGRPSPFASLSVAADDLVDRECEQGEHQLAEHLGVPADTHRVAAARVLEAGVGPLDDRADAVPDALRPDEAARARGRSSRFISSPDVARALARLVGLLLAGVANRTEHPAPARHIKPFGTVRNPLEPE